VLTGVLQRLVQSRSSLIDVTQPRQCRAKKFEHLVVRVCHRDSCVDSAVGWIIQSMTPFK
jgi:hypothetical protein